jgi:hypothetical protein
VIGRIVGVVQLQPDIAGMTDAQQRLRALLGRDIRLYGPADMIYDPTLAGSEFDDEGIPLDPLAGASAVAPANVDDASELTLLGSVRANVVFQPLAAMRRDMVAEQQIGWRSRLNKDLICDVSDMPLLAEATHFMVGTFARDSSGQIITPEQWTPDDGETWHIVNVKSDGFAALQRVIVFGQGSR